MQVEVAALETTSSTSCTERRHVSFHNAENYDQLEVDEETLGDSASG
jgi:translation elongation factor P/translation initiation factor 5A